MPERYKREKRYKWIIDRIDIMIVSDLTSNLSKTI